MGASPCYSLGMALAQKQRLYLKHAFKHFVRYVYQSEFSSFLLLFSQKVAKYLTKHDVSLPFFIDKSK